jgi:hypothetical protein
VYRGFDTVATTSIGISKGTLSVEQAHSMSVQTAIAVARRFM